MEKTRVSHNWDSRLSFLNCILAMVYMVDEDHRIVIGNQAFCEYFGISRAEEVVGKNYRDIFGEGEEGYHRKINTEIFLEKESRTSEEVIVSGKGSENKFIVYRNWYKDAAGERFVVVFNRDLRQLKEMEGKLIACEKKYEKIFEASSEAMLVFDSKGVIEVNHAACILFGYPKEDILGLRGEVLVDSKHWPMLENLKQQISFGQEKRLSIDIEGRHSDGTTFEAEVYATSFLFRDKKCLLCIVHNVTERRRMERDLSQSQRLESLGALAGGIAHDFNNLLTVLTVGVSTLQMHPEKNKAEKVLGDMKAALEMARGQTAQLLTFARGGSPVKETACIQDLVKASSKLILTGSKSRLNFWAAENIWTVEVDQNQISQVINNIVLNADQSMPYGGTIKIRVENFYVKRWSNLPLDEGDYVRISIKDQGVGISKENLPKIFDPYFSNKPEERGNQGLGLTSAFSIVKKHGGHISVESVPDVGTTFRIFLPASKDKLAKPLTEDQTSQFQKGKGRILLMDDEKLVLDLTGEMLTMFGFEVELAINGKGAIHLFTEAKRKGEPFDLVIFDLTIPGGMGGKETMARLLKIDPKAKGIVTSGYSDDDVMANFQNHGFRGAVTKPFDMESLGKAITKALDAQD